MSLLARRPASVPDSCFWCFTVRGGCVLAVSPASLLAARHGADDEVRLGAGGYRRGERGVGRFVGQVLLAGEEPHECPPRPAVVAADGAAQGRVAGFERV